jgi:hypothetical protein
MYASRQHKLIGLQEFLDIRSSGSRSVELQKYIKPVNFIAYHRLNYLDILIQRICPDAGECLCTVVI